MEYTIAWTEDAKEDVRVILDYLLDNWEDGVTNRLADEIRKVADQLSAFPYLGIQHERYSSLRLIRVKPHYRLLYAVVEEKKEVLILNMLDTPASHKIPPACANTGRGYFMVQFLYFFNTFRACRCPWLSAPSTYTPAEPPTRNVSVCSSACSCTVRSLTARPAASLSRN